MFKSGSGLDIALMIDGAPEVMLDAVDLYEDFIEMPLPLCDPAHVVSTRFADLLRAVSSEPIAPYPDAFVENIYATLMEQVFDIPQ